MTGEYDDLITRGKQEFAWPTDRGSPKGGYHELGLRLADALERVTHERDELDDRLTSALLVMHAYVRKVAQAEHFEDPEVRGCRICWPRDGSWPCVAQTVADDLRSLLAEKEPT